MQYHNNWLSCNLKTKKPEDDFQVTLNLYEFNRMNFIDAARYTAQLIDKKYDNLYVGLSGGMDSEFVAKILLEEGIKFTPILHTSDFKMYEQEYARHFCHKNGLKLEEIYISTKEFVEYCYDILFLKNGISTYPPALNNILAEHVKKKNGIFVTAHDPVYLIRKKSSDFFEFHERDFIPGAIVENCFSFFYYTLEMFYSYCNSFSFDLPTNYIKEKLYNVNFRPKIDYNENVIKILFDKLPVINSKKNVVFSQGQLYELLEKS